MHTGPTTGGNPPLALIPHSAEEDTDSHPTVLLLVQLDTRRFLPIPLALVPPPLLAHLASVRLVREAGFEGNDFLATDATARLRVVSATAIAPIVERSFDAPLAAE
ncbi:hypothetical protein [Azospirillum canadense]|uniref:hypothetical protein n=1 Tax=Azospirillum canadense TaxID=403962 RepID=UPI002226AB7C|nr:hypothetical protein [Azospirillum canadense]MCW2239342.1 hypothetical protein [Azospirillum canadense]